MGFEVAWRMNVRVTRRNQGCRWIEEFREGPVSAGGDGTTVENYEEVKNHLFIASAPYWCSFVMFLLRPLGVNLMFDVI